MEQLVLLLPVLGALSALVLAGSKPRPIPIRASRRRQSRRVP
jgi:hypothetical protein